MAEKLGARKNSSWKAICTAPDFCKTPVGSSTPPIPYQVIADLGQSESCVPNVRFNGDPCKVLDQSIVPKCTGDEPGTAKGVKSGTVADKVEPVSASTTVRAGKKRVVRELDPCTLNSGNCPGIYTTQPAPGATVATGGKPTPKEPAVTPDTPKEVQAAQEKKGIWGMVSGPMHFVLGAAGFIPGLGAVPDLLDAGVYALEGDMVNAGLSAAAAIPFAGDAVKAGTLTGKAGKQVAKAAAERTAKEAAEKVAKEAAERLAKEAAEKAAKVRAAKEAAEKAAAERAAKNKATDGVKFRKRRFPPNATFEHNGYLYKTDAQGRIVEISGELKLDKAQRNAYAQRMAGADDGRLATDQGGHLIGSQFGGTGQSINLVPMDAKVNSSSMANGTWGRMEQQWAEQLSQKNTVVVKIEPIYKTETARPDFFNVTQQINGKTTYKTIFNRPGG